MSKATSSAFNSNSVDQRDDIHAEVDALVLATCAEAAALLEQVRNCDNGIKPYLTNDAMSEIQDRAWTLTRHAMAASVATLAGVRAQIALLLAHHECQGSSPENPEVELPALRNLLRILPATV